ncbi:hypothetical protein ACFSTH_08295 [Paenibacillus yanchengensis]|uniref:Uncharacterized protein n=1 Tax=Paenibacillus yanchengensis TaxID=2035833 RepID=A0ABW4YL72_9BACL
MKVFTCNDHRGHYPVGAASVIIAEDEQQARLLLSDELVQNGLDDKYFTLQEIDSSFPKATILLDGQY